MRLTGVGIGGLPRSMYKFPPEFEPHTLPAPDKGASIAHPFTIPSSLYNDLLDVRVPLTIALAYATTVSLLNRVNKSRGNKPWAISRTGVFTLFVLVHNIFLTVYSAWTFVGMLRAMTAVFSGVLKEFPIETYGAAPIVDALCKLHGPRGFGNAVTYEPGTSHWSTKNSIIQLLGGKPDSTDVGRLWNEGLAFYGWLFYLSKFYEVLDTLIILAKGKRSSLLQTYHHAGAMMCMWAGIRFMSPPIWLFVQFNSGIHALMYFYYTLAALGIRVPNSIKRTLTTLQITQFLIGASFAFAHLFVVYQVPVNTPYLFKQAASSAISSITSAAPSVTAVVGFGSWLQKGLLRAAGFEGLAENVKDATGHRFGLDALKAQIAEENRGEIRFRMEYPMVQCLDTSGQAFAIYLNVFYLLPLTGLFARFFYISYIKRAAALTKAKQPPQALSTRMVRSGSDAAKGVDREIRQAMGDKQGYNSPIDDEFAISLQDELDSAQQILISGAQTVKSNIQKATSQTVQIIEETINGVTTKTTRIIKSEEQSEPHTETIETNSSTHSHHVKHEHDAHVVKGESYADAAKTELDEEDMKDIEETAKPQTPPPADENDASSPSALFG